MELYPILITAYNRPEKLSNLLDSLRDNSLSKNSRVVINIDGARNDCDKPQIEACRKIALEFRNEFKSLEIKVSSINNGLSKSIIKAVSNILEENQAIIVLEDDLIVSTDYLQYMNTTLNLYSSSANIGAISGYSPRVIRSCENSSGIHLQKRASSWGWGTWKDEWEKVDWSSKPLYKAQKLSRKIDKDLGQDFGRLIRYQLQNKIDSWAVRFCLSLWFNEKYTLYPFRTRILNNGLGIEATHTKKEVLHFNRFKTLREYDEIYPKKPQNSSLEELSFNIYNMNIYRLANRLINTIL